MTTEETFRFYDANEDVTQVTCTEREVWGRFIAFEDAHDGAAYLLDAEGNFMGGSVDTYNAVMASPL